MSLYKLKKGYNVKLPVQKVNQNIQDFHPTELALIPEDFRGVKLSLVIKVGDSVKVGTPIFVDRNNKNLRVVSPVSGNVKDIVRGDYGSIKRVVISSDQKYLRKEFSPVDISTPEVTRESLLDTLLLTGLFPFLRKRPFNITASPEEIPRDIFISAMDTSPLATDSDLIIGGNEEYFQKGLDILSRLTAGSVYLSIDGNKKDTSPAFTGAEQVKINTFKGAHPAGNVGVQIHHIKPIATAEDIVWHCDINSVIIIGRFFQTGELSFQKVLSLGDIIKGEQSYYKSFAGLSLKDLYNKSEKDLQIRYISGDILTGKNCSKGGFTSFYDNQLTIIKETEKKELLGWISPGFKKESFSATFISFFIPSFLRDFIYRLLKLKKFDSTTNKNGSERPFIANDFYEKVLPMDILPVFLMKSILAKDIDEMEGLGIYEVAEEDLALCEYICPSKISFQKIIREGLDYIRHEVIGK